MSRINTIYEVKTKEPPSTTFTLQTRPMAEWVTLHHVLITYKLLRFDRMRGII